MKSNSLTPVGPTTDTASGPNYLLAGGFGNIPRRPQVGVFKCILSLGYMVIHTCNCLRWRLLLTGGVGYMPEGPRVVYDMEGSGWPKFLLRVISDIQSSV